MSSADRNNITTCEVILELESAAREVRRKAGDDWSSPVSMAYYQCSLELRRIVSRHVNKNECAACREDEKQLQAAANKQTHRSVRSSPRETYTRSAAAMGGCR